MQPARFPRRSNCIHRFSVIRQNGDNEQTPTMLAHTHSWLITMQTPEFSALVTPVQNSDYLTRRINKTSSALAVVVKKLVLRTGVERKRGAREIGSAGDHFTEVVTHLISIGADRALAQLQPGRCTCHNKGSAPPHTPRPRRNPRPALRTPNKT
jgi:hypothetical protein